jgi:hypothetical protein
MLKGKCFDIFDINVLINLEGKLLESSANKTNEPIRAPLLYFLAYLAVFFVLTYVYACIAALRFAPLSGVFGFALNWRFFALLVASAGLTYLFDKLRRKIRRLPKAELPNGFRNLLYACVCVAASLALEVTLFQCARYGVLFTGRDIVSFGNYDQITLSDATTNLEGIYLNKALLDDSGDENAPQNAETGGNVTVTFTDLNRRVSSVHVAPAFPIDDVASFPVRIIFDDEALTQRVTGDFTIVRGLEHTHYIPIYPAGEVSSVTVVFPQMTGMFYNISFNETIPLSPVFLRMLLVASILLAIAMLRRYDIFSARFDPKSRYQRGGFVITILCLAIFCIFTALTNDGGIFSNGIALGSDNGQYGVYLADAIINGRTWLNIPGAEIFQSVERPYDWAYRESIGLRGNVDYPWDTVYYDGRYYSYFGVVPCLLLHVPYTLVTGKHLPPQMAACFFGVLSMISLSFLYRKIITNFTPRIPYIIYVMGQVAFAMCSFLPYIVRYGRFYETVLIAGVMFCAAGFWLLLKFMENVQYRNLWLVLSCLCFSLAVGCRPNLIFCFIFIPALGWTTFRNSTIKQKVGMLVWAALPTLIAAIPLMMYNYTRFGSVTEFGSSYQLSGQTMSSLYSLTPNAALVSILNGVKGYFFNSINILTEFPFVQSRAVSTQFFNFKNYDGGIFGVFSLPIMWGLLALPLAVKRLHKPEEDRRIFKIVTSALSVAVLLFLVDCFIGTVTRYLCDFMWLLLVADILAINTLFFRAEAALSVPDMGQPPTKVLSCVMLVSILLSAFYTVSIMWRDHQAIYHYLVRAFDFFGGI